MNEEAVRTVRRSSPALGIWRQNETAERDKNARPVESVEEMEAVAVNRLAMTGLASRRWDALSMERQHDRTSIEVNTNISYHHFTTI